MDTYHDDMRDIDRAFLGAVPSQHSVGRGYVVLVSLSDFTSGRGFYISQALRKLQFRVSIVTNLPLYGRGSAVETSDFGIAQSQFKIPFAQTLYKSIAGRMWVYVAFSVIAFFRMMKFKTRILYCRPPHPFSDMACLLYKLFHPDVKIISDTTDLWPDSLMYFRANRFMKAILVKLGFGVNSIVYNRVDAIVTHNSELKKILQSRFSKPVFIVPGAIDTERFRMVGKEEAAPLLEPELRQKLANKFVVMHAGTLGPFQQPDLMIDLAERLDDRFCIVILGAGLLETDMRRRAHELCLTNIMFLGTQPHENMPAFYAAADAFLFTSSPPRSTRVPSSFLKIVLPKKFIEYSASGRPIICVCDPCIASELCDSYNAGFVIHPDDLDGVLSKILLLKTDSEMSESLGKNARRMAEEIFSIQAAARELDEVFDSLESK